MKALKLYGMAKALEEQLQMPDSNALTFEERFGLLVDRERTERGVPAVAGPGCGEPN